jgi:hypothetical protein
MTRFTQLAAVLGIALVAAASTQLNGATRSTARTLGNGTYHGAFKPYCLVDGVQHTWDFTCDDGSCEADGEDCTWTGTETK